MTQDAIINRTEVDNINSQYHNGELTYVEALVELTRVAERINAKGKEIAKKYNRRFSPFTASNLLTHGGTR